MRDLNISVIFICSPLEISMLFQEKVFTSTFVRYSVPYMEVCDCQNFAQQGVHYRMSDITRFEFTEKNIN